MGILKNLFKNYETKRATNKINAKAFKLAKKLKRILVSIGWINYPIDLNGIKFIIRVIRDITGSHYYIAILDKNDREFYFDINKPITLYNHCSGENEIFYPTRFWENKYFLEHADGIFNEARTMQEKHKEKCSKVLEQVKDL